MGVRVFNSSGVGTSVFGKDAGMQDSIISYFQEVNLTDGSWTDSWIYIKFP